jgi:hypothetical protein
MDPITTAILAAIAAGVAASSGKVAEKTVLDGYNALKAILLTKFGQASYVIKAVDSVEARPDSPGRKETLREEIVASKADKDPEILEAAQTLVKMLKATPSGEQHIQSAIGSYIAQADSGSTAKVEINKPRE